MVLFWLWILFVIYNLSSYANAQELSPPSELVIDSNTSNISAETEPKDVDPCAPRATKPQVNFHVNIGIPSYFHNLSAGEIEAKFKNYDGFKSTHKDSKTPGIANAKMGTKISTGVEVISNGQKTCVHLSSIDFEIGFSELAVYVDKTYPENSCKYNAVLEHENTHVRIHQKTLKQYARELANMVYQKSVNMPPQEIPNNDNSAAQNVISQIEANIKSIGKDYRSRIEQAANVQHKDLDSKESYEQTRALCKNW